MAKKNQLRFFDELAEAMDKTSKKGNGTEALRVRVRDCATSLELFAKTYFPDVFTSEFSELHKEIFKSAEEMILRRKRRKNYYVRAAPRGHGKSQVISYLLIIWCICYKYKQNILLVSDTLDQAKSFISAIKTELEENERIKADFGDLSSEEKWAQDKIITSNKVQVYGRGAGQKLRGNKYGSIRPELVIIDDLENDEAVETEAQRRKLFNWFMKALLPVGTPTTDYIFIGTVLHYEALLQKLLTEPTFSMWDRKRYQAVTKFSDSPLWDEWETIMLDENNDNAGEDAYKFYKKNRAEMLEGVESLWPASGADYYENMMELRVSDPSSFASEYQNEPIDPSQAEFLPEWFDYYYELPEIVEVYGACDPSLGKAKSDRAAIIWAGKDKQGYLYILDVLMGRYKPDRIIDLIIAGSMKYQSHLKSVVIETVQFQAMFKDEVAKRGLNAGIQIPITEFNDKTPKEVRLRGLIPRIKNKYIKFRKDQTVLVNEFLRFPKASDDGMDAVNMICSAAFPVTGQKLVFGGISSNIRPKFNPMGGIFARWR
ncbi:putative phage protein (plasmid) [Selenomonas ruminantium subsp. lactilytica TAM6421]|uniref:Putative phage protein n=1 Tax=Selenomonas ruminantium subsp. lactilytica (strain NBRC 103574 / TAM6421) TaxID=927704 RepID=I0GV89_SELRL|nr:phage terminase large subunit [Selenomonas ruminantium]BAL84676.1 putative phage protein [Selenomonas ruminantium subsp. lactilytica TAM6421]